MATGDVTLKYSAASSSLTVTLLGLTNTGARQCVSFSNSASNFTDAQLLIQLQTTTGTHGDAFACYVHGYCSPNNTNWTFPITTSTDLAVTITTGMNLVGPWVVNFGTSATGLAAQVAVIPSLANFFGGQLPAQFGFVVENRTNVSFGSTSANFGLTVFPTYENVST